MKSLILLLLLLPVLFFNLDIDMENNGNEDKLSMSDVSVENIDNEASPINIDLTSKSESSLAMEMLDYMVVEFDPSSGISGEANGQGITNGTFVIAMSSSMTSKISVGAGMPISSVGATVQDMNITRYSDINTTKIRSLLILGTVIPYIEVHYLSSYAGLFKINHTMRYEDCIFTSYSGGASSGENGNITENISFSFEKACYRSFERDTNGVETDQSNACIDRTESQQAGCACTGF